MISDGNGTKWNWVVDLTCWLALQELRDGIESAKKQRDTLKQQISESESNLAAQQSVTMDQTKVLGSEAVKKARWEHLELLASDTGLDLEEMDTVFQVNEFISNSNPPYFK